MQILADSDWSDLSSDEECLPHESTSFIEREDVIDEDDDKNNSNNGENNEGDEDNSVISNQVSGRMMYKIRNFPVKWHPTPKDYGNIQVSIDIIMTY